VVGWSVGGNESPWLGRVGGVVLFFFFFFLKF